MRFDKFLQTKFPEHSRSQIAHAIKRGDLTVNGKKVKAGYDLQRDDVVAGTITVPGAQAVAENIPLEVVYEDQHLMIINKPRGMVVHPGAGIHSGTVLNGLLARGQGKLERAGIVHRLDKNTAGLLVVAKTGKCMEKLGAMFAAHAVTRTYWGLVAGRITADMTIDQNIVRHPQHRTIFTTTEHGGRHAVTHLHVLETYAQATWCEFTLETGRTHQIRVHCKSINHPILNDPEYNSGDGQMLEAVKLEFVHPITGKQIHVQVPPTKEFASWRQKCYTQK